MAAIFIALKRSMSSTRCLYEHQRAKALDGQVSVKVPAGTQPDSMLRLRGKGLPRFGGGSRGDLYVRLRVHVPERLSDRQRRLFEQLRGSGTRQAEAKA